MRKQLKLALLLLHARDQQRDELRVGQRQAAVTAHHGAGQHGLHLLRKQAAVAAGLLHLLPPRERHRAQPHQHRDALAAEQRASDVWVRLRHETGPWKLETVQVDVAIFFS